MAIVGSPEEGAVFVDINPRRGKQKAYTFRMALGGSLAEESGAVLTCLIDINPRCGE